MGDPKDSLSGMQSNDFGYSIVDYNIKEVERQEVNILPKLDVTSDVVVNELPLTNGTSAVLTNEPLITAESPKVYLTTFNSNSIQKGYMLVDDSYPKKLKYRDNTEYGIGDTWKKLKNKKKAIAYLEDAYEILTTPQTGELTMEVKNIDATISKWKVDGDIEYVDNGPYNITIGTTDYKENVILESVIAKLEQKLMDAGYQVIKVTNTGEQKNLKQKTEDTKVTDSDSIFISLDIGNNIGAVVHPDNTKLQSFAKGLPDELKVVLGADASSLYENKFDITAYNITKTNIININLGDAVNTVLPTLTREEIQEDLADLLLKKIKDAYPR